MYWCGDCGIECLAESPNSILLWESAFDFCFILDAGGEKKCMSLDAWPQPANKKGEGGGEKNPRWMKERAREMRGKTWGVCRSPKEGRKRSRWKFLSCQGSVQTHSFISIQSVSLPRPRWLSGMWFLNLKVDRSASQLCGPGESWCEWELMLVHSEGQEPTTVSQGDGDKQTEVGQVHRQNKTAVRREGEFRMEV